MNLPIVIFSILAITGFVWLLNRITPYKVCPICAGVSGTWLFMLGARFLGYSIDPTILAMLLGASVVGIAYALEKKLPQNRSKLLWKVLFIPAGFAAAYALVQTQWFLFAGMLALLLLFSYAFLRAAKQKEISKNVENLEEKMKQCC
ncbi:MAG: hypothetical protein Q7K38_01415 [Candidatus Wildermuthbacteria bacterium]|nr:hypothetical protein [Candidatus Wildermuthbacteria bacterium]